MSCFNPITIRNSKADYISGVDRVYFNVGCGKCYGCQKEKRNEWFVRMYYQWKFYQSIGGCTMFITLTWDDQHIPTIEVDGIKYKCFSKYHVQKYLNTLRQRLKRKYGIGKDHSIGLTYFIACEYGSKTHRPHLHALLHFPPSSAKYSDLMKDAAECWPNGRCEYSDKGAFVNDIKAIKYCAKYAGKDVEFLNEPHIKRYLMMLEDEKKENIYSLDNVKKTTKLVGFSPVYPFEPISQINYKVTAKLIKSNKTNVDKWFMPRHYQSKGYGILLLDELYNYSKDELYKALYHGIRLQSTDNNLVNVPRYISNKLLYNNVKVLDKQGFEHSVRKYNSFGLEFKKDMINKQIKDTAARIEKNCSVLGLCTMLPSAKYAENLINLHTHSNYNFACFNDIKEFLNLLKCDYSFEDVAKYKLFQRGRVHKYSVDSIFAIAIANNSIPIEVWTPSLLESREFYNEEFDKLIKDRNELDHLLDILDIISADYNARRCIRAEIEEQQKQTFIHKLYFTNETF